MLVYECPSCAVFDGLISSHEAMRARLQFSGRAEDVPNYGTPVP
jgi:hypothetical protein